MRHLRGLTIQVLLLTLGVIVATLERGLVLLPGSLQGRLPPLLCAVGAAVLVAPIAGRTDRHGGAAPGAIKLSASQIDRRVQTARLDHRGEIGDALLMRLSLIAAAASGGPERLLRASTFLCIGPQPIPHRGRQLVLHRHGHRDTAVDDDLKRGEVLRSPGRSTDHGLGGAVKRGP